jgi:membrane associated rhomboid family serine protease
MLVVPHAGSMNWKNPPAVTLLLILVNCFVFFVWQGNEGRYYREAQEYYVGSGLARIETEAYSKYLEDTGQQQKLASLREEVPDPTGPRLMTWQEMRQDEVFQQQLAAEQIITPQMQIYGRWKLLRLEYDRLMGQSVTARYGYKPAQGSLLCAFTYMFLHGSPMHLLGNMVFLWLVGCMIEIGCSRLVYSAVYLFTGVAAALVFGLVYPGNTAPLVGASGAIAGLMGLYTILFAGRRVGVFISLGFYFTNTKVPAIVLLPFWVGNELYQLFGGGPSNVAYVAHLGGLFSGVLAGLAQKKFLGGVRETAIGQELADSITALMESGLKRLADLDFSGARILFEQVRQKDPNNPQALLHLFHIDKQTPTDDILHITANRLFAALCRTPGTEQECIALYREYRDVTGRPELSPENYATLLRLLLKNGQLEESAAILSYLLKNHAAMPQLPGILLNLAKAYHRQGTAGNARKCLQVLCKRYPDTTEYRIADSLLRQYESTA